MFKNLFYKRPINGWLHDEEAFLDDDSVKHLWLPVNLDTEYETQDGNKLYKLSDKNTIITTIQTRPIQVDDEALIFAHKDVEHLARHPIFETEHIFIDMLRVYGYEAELFYSPDDYRQCKRTLTLNAFAHFAVADMLKSVQGRMLDDLLRVFKTRKGSTQPHAVQGRRLIFQQRSGGFNQQYIDMSGWVVFIDGYSFRLRLAVVDSAAVGGQSGASLAGLAEIAGYVLPYKDALTQFDKENMVKTYGEKPEEFDNYAKGDCYVEDILRSFNKQVNHVFRQLGRKETANIFMTLGRNVMELIRFNASRPILDVTEDKNLIREYAKAKGIEMKEVDTPEKLLSYMNQTATAEYLKDRTHSTAFTLAKTDGGRCRNNRGLVVKMIGVLLDLDIGGCYGEGQRIQQYPYGTPALVEFDNGPNRSDNRYIDGNELIKTYLPELVPGLWAARFDVSELTFKQDYFPSWILPKKLDLMGETEMLEADDEWLKKGVGDFKHYYHQISNGMLTHDGWQWINTVLTRKERREFLSKMRITAMMFYPKSCRRDTVEEVIKDNVDHNGKNTVSFKIKDSKGIITNKQGYCMSWTSRSLGELYIDELLANRALHPKREDGRKNPLNVLFKDFVNGSYGDLVSIFFSQISNVVVSNNITARARCLAWYMEKGLYALGIITDGGVVNVNEVAYPKIENGKYRHIGSDAWCTLSSLEFNRTAVNRDLKLTIKPLGGYDKFEYSHSYVEEKEDGGKTVKVVWNVIKAYKDGSVTEIPVTDDATGFFDKLCLEHCQNLFQGVDVLHDMTTEIKVDNKGSKEPEPKYHYIPRKGQYGFAGKDMFSGIVCHGSSDYAKQGFNGLIYDTKFRSYETKKKHFNIDGSTYELPEALKPMFNTKVETPIHEMAGHLFTTPNAVPRSAVTLKTGVLKTNEYKTRADLLQPGETVTRYLLPREFSLSTYTFLSREQHESWTKALDTLKTRYDQTLEMFYLNEDGTVRYEEMVQDVYWSIWNGDMKPRQMMDTNNNASRSYIAHPQQQNKREVKEQLGNKYKSATGYSDEDEGWMEMAM